MRDDLEKLERSFNEKILLQVPACKWTKSTTARMCAFCLVAPAFWDGLSKDVRRAANPLASPNLCKTELFKKAFFVCAGTKLQCTKSFTKLHR